MDIDLKLLGPYASQLNKARDKRSEQPSNNNRNSNRANFTALYKKQNIKFLQDADARRQGRQQQMEQHRRGRRSQRIAEGRKPTMTEMTNDINIMVIQDDNSHEISALQSSDEPSSLNEQKAEVISGEACDVDVNMEETGKSTGNDGAGDKKPVNGKAKNAPITGKGGSKQDQNRKPSPARTAKDFSRRDQLQKWKKEKEAADLKAKRTQRQPFKVGAPVATKPVASTSITGLAKSVNSTANATSSSLLGGSKSSSVMLGSNKSKTVVTSARQPTGQATSRGEPKVAQQQASNTRPAVKPVTGPVAASKPNDIRRVTRAMTKVTPPSTASNSVNGNNSKSTIAPGIAKAPIQKMKALNISEKEKAPAKPGISGGKTAAAAPAIGNKSVKPSTNSKSRVAATSTTAGIAKKGPSPPASSKDKARKTVEHTEANPVNRKEKSLSPNLSEEKPKPQPSSEPTVKKKKAKPKAIDATYTDYNGRFSDACRKLGGLSMEWRPLLEDQGEVIPADIQDEIYSALGAVKLLLESKLPQFGELLYAYLCKDEDATIILACDLEGWWDVAYIQVEAVYKRFETLAALKNNQWSKPEPPPPAQPEQKVKRHSSDGDVIISQSVKSPFPPSRRVTKPKVQASGGLKAFLANKRKQLDGNSGSAAVITTQSIPTSGEQPMDVSFSSTVSSSTTAIVERPPLPTTGLTPNLQKSNLHLNLHQGNDQDEDHLSNRKFEGGFFTISSPLATPTTPRERRQKQYSTDFSFNELVGGLPGALRTPGRGQRLSGVSSVSDASLRRASMSVLGVRRSMGSFSRIGAVSMFTEEQENGRE